MFWPQEKYTVYIKFHYYVNKKNIQILNNENTFRASLTDLNFLNILLCTLPKAVNGQDQHTFASSYQVRKM